MLRRRGNREYKENFVRKPFVKRPVRSPTKRLNNNINIYVRTLFCEDVWPMELTKDRVSYQVLAGGLKVRILVQKVSFIIIPPLYLH